MKFPKKNNIFVVGIYLLCSIACVGNAQKENTALFKTLNLPDSLSLQEACTQVSSELLTITHVKSQSVNLNRFNAVIATVADSLRKVLGKDASGSKGARAIVGVVYGSWKIGFDPQDSLLETLLPGLVYQNKRGACLGVSLMILMLAEKLQCPIFGVMLPGHFFCRYDDGVNRFNIEPNKSGFNHPDEYYLRKYQVSNKSWYDLHNLSKNQTLGAVCFNAGNVLYSYKKYAKACDYFTESIRQIPWFVEAKGNLAISYAKCGNLSQSKLIFDTLLVRYPDLSGLAANYGAVLVGLEAAKK